MKTILILVVACLLAHADDAACTVKDFRGVYGFHSQTTNVTNNALLTFAGSFTADGDGKITAWKDQAVLAANPIVPPNFKVVTDVLDRYEQSRSLGGEILYTVEPDCRMRIAGTFIGPTGAPSPVAWTGALVGGGRGALLMGAGPQSPYISILTVKRADRGSKGKK